MELNFTETNGLYVASKEVNDDYNLHVECDLLSDIIVSQKTSGTEYAEVHAYHNVRTIDDDFDSIIYPKTIKITSTKPATGYILEAE